MKKVAWIRIILYLLAFSSAIPMSAQLLWNSYKVPRGVVFESIFQDSKGYFWLGDAGHVHRFDGLSWEVFSLGDSIHAAVISFAERSNGELWIGLNNGDVFFRKSNRWQKFDPEEGTPKKPVTALLFDQEDKLWISSYGEGLYYLLNERLYNIDQTEGLPSDDVYAAVLGEDGKIWCATDRGVGIVWLENGKKTTRQIGKTEGISDEISTSLSKNHNNTISIGLYDGNIATFNTQSEQIKETLNSSTHPIKQVLHDGGDLWILDQDGYLWNQRDGEIIKIQTPGLVKFILLSEDGRIWIVDQKNNLSSAPIFLRKAIKLDDAPQAICQDAQSGLWLGNTKGLFHFNILTNELNPIPESKNLNISSLFADQHKRIWVGTLGQGLWFYEPSQKSLSPVSLSGTTSKVPILSISGNQKTLWVATFGGAYLCNLSPEGFISSEQHFKEADGLGINYIYHSVTAPSGSTYLATDGQGLGKWENGKLHLDKDLVGSSIFSISIDSAGGIWLLGDEGEIMYKKGTQCDTLLAFKDQQALAIQAISPERVILVYEKELFYMDKSTNHIFPLLTANQFSGFGSHLNVLSLNKNGTLWLGSPQALLQIDTRKIPKNISPKSRIKQVLINLQTAEENRQVFEHDEKHITFDYTALWYVEPERISFRHRLKGHDLSWVESRNQRVVYADLTPGKYFFELQMGMDDIYLEESQSNYSFEIKKPLWLRPIFLIPFFLFLFAFLYWVIQNREANITKNQELLRKSIEHQFETLRNQINPHFLFNAFSTLTDLVEEAPDKAVGYINRLSDLFRDVLTYRDQPVISLGEELRIMDNYYALQKERYGKNFSLCIDIPPKYHDKKVPPLVLQILLENTLRHNTASKKQPLSVSIFIEKDQVIIQNPIQLRSSVPNSTKVGLQNIRERYLLLTKKEVEIYMDETVFTVKLPLLI